MIAIHYYLLFDGSDEVWQHTKALYEEGSVFRYEPLFLVPDEVRELFVSMT